MAPVAPVLTYIIENSITLLSYQLLLFVVAFVYIYSVDISLHLNVFKNVFKLN